MSRLGCNRDIEFVNVTICCCSRNGGRRGRWTNLNKQNDSLAVRFIFIVSSLLYRFSALVKWTFSMMLTRCVSFKDQSSGLNSSLSPSIVLCVLGGSYLFPRQIYDAKQNSAAFPFPYLVKAVLTTPTTTIYARHPFDCEDARILHPLSACAMISTHRQRTSVSIRVIKVTEENVQDIRSCSLTIDDGFHCTHLSFR